MPNKASAKKELRKAKKRTAQNATVKSNYRKAIKEVVKALEGGEKNVADKVRLVQKKLDKATKKGLIKKNTAARKLSRLTKKANKVK